MVQGIAGGALTFLPTLALGPVLEHLHVAAIAGGRDGPAPALPGRGEGGAGDGRERRTAQGAGDEHLRPEAAAQPRHDVERLWRWLRTLQCQHDAPHAARRPPRREGQDVHLVRSRTRRRRSQ
jgi:hypothetical protein